MASTARADGQALLDELAAEFLDLPGVERAPMFGSEALRVHGKVFAFVDGEGALVVKVPQGRATDLVNTGAATRIKIGRNPAREWIGVPMPIDGDTSGWRGLIGESHRFVASNRG